jgi:antitoxin VapB
MSLNIKNAETVRLTKELAEATGESLTAAVTTAVRERLERVRETDAAQIEADIARMTEIARFMREQAPPGYFDQDFDELLYDESGLPK